MTLGHHQQKSGVAFTKIKKYLATQPETSVCYPLVLLWYDE